MKKLITILTLITLVAASFAQAGEKLGIRPYGWTQPGFKTESLSVNTSTESVSVLYLRDGQDNSYTAVAYPVFQVTGLQNRVTIVALGSFANNQAKTQVYAGTGIGVQLIKTQSLGLTAYAGLTGLDASNNFSFTSGKQAWIFGAGINLAVGK